jgi:glutathione S-transferase kappa 1
MKLMQEQPVHVAMFIKSNYPAEEFEATFEALASGYWSKGINVSTPEGLHKALDGIFFAQEVDQVMKKALAPENKKRVIDMMKGAGAFGASWIVAVNRNGEKRSWLKRIGGIRCFGIWECHLRV